MEQVDGEHEVNLTDLGEEEGTTTDAPAHALSGGLVLAAMAVLTLIAIFSVTVAIGEEANAAAAAVAAILGLVVIAGLPGFFILEPNNSRVVIVLGRYTGTVAQAGFWWVNPLAALASETISLRVRNFNSQRSKVNDARGNPIELAAVVVWRVVDSARAVFDVNDFENFVQVQSETAVRHLAQQYPYDTNDPDGLSLSRDSDTVSSSLHDELQRRLDAAGVEVIEARLTDLAYATEIAESMLRRQQAEAIVAAREKIVEGAVGMVELALDRLRAEDIIDLDEERRAAMVSNLMTVLCSDQPTNPVVNVGTLY